ncbi:hypothetical protein Bca4012_057598 [Brassica carinata]
MSILDERKREMLNHWCAIGKLLFCHRNPGRILWCEPDELDWKEVTGFEELKKSICGLRDRYDICKLCCNSVGNIVFFSNTHLHYSKGLEPMSAEISFEDMREAIFWGRLNGPVLSSKLILSHTNIVLRL